MTAAGTLVRRTVVGLLLAATTGAGVATLPGIARAAADGVPTIVLGGPGQDEVLPLKVERLAPGSSEVARYVLRRGEMFAAGGFSFAVVGIKDYEDGCNRPENDSGDTSCGDGPDQGELSRQLLVGQAWSNDVGRCADATVPGPGRPMSELNGVVLTAPAEVSAGDAACLVLSLVLPVAADNLVQSDRVGFGLRLALTDAQPSETLGGGGGGPVLSEDQPVLSGGQPVLSGEMPSSGVPGGATLPFTGTFIGSLLLPSAVLIGFGTLLLLAARRRSPR
ncbi:MAG: hypothetical protein JWN87_2868 [Frankiales bacterium]|nr:hypothetical protein [Frankiales bacterium]